MLIVPCRPAPVVLSLTMKLIVALPVPLPSELMVIQLALLTTVQLQSAAAAMRKLLSAPVELKAPQAGEIAYPQVCSVAISRDPA